MQEIIKEIKEELPNGYEGYSIITNKQTIEIGISDYQKCCEDAGYMSSEDDFKDFIGAEILSIESVDTAKNVKKLEENVYYREACCMFVNINTNKGTFQIVLYNEHNGYYGHSAYVKSTQLNEHACL